MVRLANKMTLLLGAAALLLIIVTSMLVFSRRTSPVGTDMETLNAAMDELLRQPKATDSSGGKKAGGASVTSGSTASGAMEPAGAARSVSTSTPSATVLPDAAGGGRQGEAAQRIDLNKATAGELDVLPGIGPSKAQAIIDYRTEHGLFKSVEELLEVKGIGPKMVEKLRPLLFVQ